MTDKRHFNTCTLALAVFVLASFAGFVSLARCAELDVVARIGPWPVLSRLVGYRGKVWFANSVKGVNHNSADIWSYDPSTGQTRYERHLLSQDAGKPLVYQGLLYWPYEDPRASLGWGAIDVTNGTAWSHLVIPTARIFHVHSLVEWQGQLLAASSAWRAGFQISSDRGTTWRELYDHPTPERRVSRITDLAVANDDLIARLRDPDGLRLAHWNGSKLENVAGWPQGNRLHSLTPHQGVVYLVSPENPASTIWKVGNTGAARIPHEQAKWTVRALASDGERLWAAVGGQQGVGALWTSRNGETWHHVATFSGGIAWEVLAHGGSIYVAGQGDDGRGILWRFNLADASASEPTLDSPSPLPDQTHSGGHRDWVSVGRKIDQALGDIANYDGHGWRLRDLLYDAVKNNEVRDGFLSARLGAQMPETPVDMLGGQFTVPARHLGQWIILWAMGQAGKPEVPSALLSRAWSVPQHPSEKYFDPQVMALWAVQQSGQRDSRTLAILKERLDRSQDPSWLRRDAEGVLTMLTQRQPAQHAR